MNPDRARFRVVQPDEALPEMGGGGTFGGMEARVAKLESTCEHILREMAEMKADIRDLRKDGQRDFRIQFGALIAAALGLAGLMAKGFHWL